jgi:hypothetical protein
MNDKKFLLGRQAWSFIPLLVASEMFAFEAVTSVVGIAGMAGAIGGIPLPPI